MTTLSPFLNFLFLISELKYTNYSNFFQMFRIFELRSKILLPKGEECGVAIVVRKKTNTDDSDGTDKKESV